MKKILISVITSEKTWKNLSKYGFDDKLRKERDKFDLAVILNGYDKDAVEFYNCFHPEYFLLRPNLGFDAAAIAFWIKLIPLQYEYYLLLHDDHWFEEPNWLEKLEELTRYNRGTDVWGNILYGVRRKNFDEYCKSLNSADLIEHHSDDYLHGMSGLFTMKAVAELKKQKISYWENKEKEYANIGERYFTSVLNYLDLLKTQIGNGPFRFLKHGDGNYKNYLFAEATMFVYKNDYIKAKEFYYKYYEYCKNAEFYDDFPLLFLNLAHIHFTLNEKEEAKLYWSIINDKFPQYQLPEEAIELIDFPEKHTR